MSLLETLTQQLTQGENLNALGKQLGLDSGLASTAISAALPMIVGAMARNASSDEGAANLSNALDKDHDGGILDQLGGFLGSTDNGAGASILGHVFGQKRGGIEAGLSQISGVDKNQAGSLLENLAPIVMGQLGKQKREQGLNPMDIASMLGGAAQQQQSSGGSMAMDILSNVLDQDGDGSMMDDIGGMLGGLFGGKK